MNGPDALATVAALFGAVTFARVIPLAVLAGMSLLFVWVMFKAQASEGFDASMFLRNDRGVLAPERLWGFLCFAIHTWAYTTWVLNNVVTENDSLLYVGAWSGTAIVFQILEVWRGIKTNTPPLPKPNSEGEQP